MGKDEMLFFDDHPLFIEEMTQNEIGFPERLVLEMTSYCNLRCWMCPKTAGYVNTTPNQLVKEDVIREVEKILPKIEVLMLSGLWGEVFMHPDVYVRILQTAKEFGCEVRTISNGTLLTPKLSEALVDIGLDSLTISIDAATSKTYKEIRVGGNFRKLVKRLKKLKLYKEKKGKNKPEVYFGFVGMKRNIEELPHLVELAAELGIQGIILQGMGEYEDTEGQSLAYHHRDVGKRYYQQALEKGGELGVTVSLFPPDQFEDSSLHFEPARGEIKDDEDFKIPSEYRKNCDIPWKETVITTSGDVLPCCSAMKPVGNILDEPFEKIWSSSRYKEFRRRILSETPPSMCVACTGVGWRKATILRDYLKMGETDGQLGLGWYHLEHNPYWERTYRWTKQKATFFLMSNSQNKAISIEMRIAGKEKRGNIFINGRKIGKFAIDHSEWVTFKYDLPNDISDVLKVEIQVENPAKEGEDSRRYLGVAVANAILS